ncbi:hypothetical protein AB1Y20_011022 [Prymnesium parvum]|uniref:Solute carrier family 40 protein n=1 Tax=Prymnesium parvum TaxID=97485 RepID=A0AB34IKK6_PRYPA
MLFVAGGVGHLVPKRRADEASGAPLLRAITAAFVIFSDDLGVGYSVFREVFPASLVSALFVLAAIQAFTLNPVVFIWLGLAAPPQCSLRAATAVASTPPPASSPLASTQPAAVSPLVHTHTPLHPAAADGRISPRLDLLEDEAAVPPSQQQTSRSTLRVVMVDVLRGIRTNPFLLMVGAGLAYNGIFGRSLPFWLDSVTKLLASPFTGLIMFLAGCASVGAFSTLFTLRLAVFPVALVSLKCIVVPIISHQLTLRLGGTSDETDFSFLYGVLPSANIVLVLARLHHAPAPLLATLSAAMALSKVIAFLLIFLSTAILHGSHQLLEHLSFQLTHAALWASAVGASLLLLLLLSLRLPSLDVLYRQVVGLVLLQLAHSAASLAAAPPHDRPQWHAALIGGLRCACDGWTAGMLLDQAIAPPWLPLALASALALGLTLPWAAAPPRHSSSGATHARLPSSQLAAYTAAYATLALLVSSLLVLLLQLPRQPQRVATEPSSRVESARLDAEPMVSRDASLRSDGLALRVRVLSGCLLIRCLAVVGTCSSLLYGSTFDGTVAVLGLVLVLFADFQGILSFVLFGMQLEVLDAIAPFLRALGLELGRRQFLRLLCCLEKRNANAHGLGESNGTSMPLGEEVESRASWSARIPPVFVPSLRI